MLILVCLALGCHRRAPDPSGCTIPPSLAGLRRLPLAVLEDKIRGGWAGQMIGVTCGAPFEFHARGATLDGDLRGYDGFVPRKVEDALSQDDLYVDATFAQVMDRVGLDATLADYAAALAKTRYPLFHANAAARRLLAQGAPPERAGDPLWNLHTNDIDFQIEADFIGLMTPGLPADANRYATRVGRLVSHGDGLYGGLFVASLYAAAFFETSPRELVEVALQSIPAESGYAAAVRDVLGWCSADADWRATWRKIEDASANRDVCPSGALEPFDIDARLNGAYVVLGLLHGNGDFARTLEIVVRAGQDTDSNAATALGVLGAAVGYASIPDAFKSGIPRIADRRFDHTDVSFNDLVASTRRRAIAAVIRAGGACTGETLLVPDQAPSPPPLEQLDMGLPAARIEAASAAWTWGGAWRDAPGAVDAGQPWQGKQSGQAGACAELHFSGTGIAILGPLGPAGGRADVHLDGVRQARLLDAYAPPRTWDHDLFHTFGLADGPHTLKIEIRPDADRPSSGHEITVFGAISFRPSDAHPAP
ncbi:putative membrane protein [Minicystis rosea]|nr:putative membrane protein [Minicystis rosea]